jgi:hypothetical protein
MYSSLILGLTSVVTVSGARISLPPRTKENLLNKYDSKFQNTFYEIKTGGQNTIRIRIRRHAENAKYFYEALTCKGQKERVAHAWETQKRIDIGHALDRLEHST